MLIEGQMYLEYNQQEWIIAAHNMLIEEQMYLEYTRQKCEEF